MRNLRELAILGVLVFWAALANATDGGVVTLVTEIVDTQTGSFDIKTRYLCDGTVQATPDNRTCSVFDLAASHTLGMPSIAIVELANTTSCDAGFTVTITTGPQSATAAANADVHDGVILDATTTRAIFTWPSSIPDRFLHTVIAGTGDNCNPIDVIVLLYYESSRSLLR